MGQVAALPQKIAFNASSALRGIHLVHSLNYWPNPVGQPVGGWEPRVCIWVLSRDAIPVAATCGTVLGWLVLE